MAIGIESKGESYGLLIDAVGEVIRLSVGDLESNPVNLDARLARVSAGVHRLDGNLLVVLDVDRVLKSVLMPRRHERTRNVKRTVSGNGDLWSPERGSDETCLVVDDSSVIRKVARRILEGLEFEIARPRTVSRHSKSAAARCRWDPARLDHAEDGRLMSSCARCARCRRATAPRWCLHHRERRRAYRAGAHAGANEYIMKPFDKEIVEAKFQEVGLI